MLGILSRLLVPVCVFSMLVLAGEPVQAAKKKGEAASPERLAEARELLDAEDPEAALELLDPYVKKRSQDAEALFLRSTAHFMVGDTEAGRQDLKRSLEIDPEQRQGWLNLGALAVAEERWDDAVEAFRRAEELDPEAPENDLNLGAVLLLRGDLTAASERFREYLSRDDASADDYYLVATNYAMAGYAALAVEHLREAVERNERARLRAKTDPNFLPLSGNPQFRDLVETDVYELPPGSYRAARKFNAPYDPAGGGLLRTVLDALQLSGASFDPRVELTPDWALIWGDLRIKVERGAQPGTGVVQVSAPSERFTPAEWQRRVTDLFREIETRLLVGN